MHLRKAKTAAEFELAVTPAQAGVQKVFKRLDSGFRRNDDEGQVPAEDMLGFVPHPNRRKGY
jgi:hypothetical protein